MVSQPFLGTSSPRTPPLFAKCPPPSHRNAALKRVRSKPVYFKIDGLWSGIGPADNGGEICLTPRCLRGGTGGGQDPRRWGGVSLGETNSPQRYIVTTRMISALGRGAMGAIFMFH